MAALAACKLPLSAETEASAVEFDVAEQVTTCIRTEVEGVAAETATSKEPMSRLAHGETVPTPDAVGAALSLRDRVWRHIRRVHDGGAPAEAGEQASLPPGPLPDTFEAIRDDADRHADDAQRGADYLTATARLGFLDGPSHRAGGGSGRCQ